MTRAVILVERGFQDEEFVYAYYRMLEERWEVDVAKPARVEDPCGKFGVPARANKAIELLRWEDYDAVVIPGGFESPDRLRMREDVQNFVRSMWVHNRLIAAICHAPSVIISSGIGLKGKRMTGYPSIKDDLVNAGAVYDEAPVVKDGNIITAPHYRNNGEFMGAVIECIDGRR